MDDGRHNAVKITYSPVTGIYRAINPIHGWTMEKTTRTAIIAAIDFCEYLLNRYPNDYLDRCFDQEWLDIVTR